MVVVLWLDEKRFYFSAGRLARAEQLGRNDAGVVQNEDVACFQQIQNLGEAKMFNGAGLAVEIHQPGTFTLIGRLLGDAAGREFVVEIGQLHA